MSDILISTVNVEQELVRYIGDDWSQLNIKLQELIPEYNSTLPTSYYTLNLDESLSQIDFRKLEQEVHHSLFASGQFKLNENSAIAYINQMYKLEVGDKGLQLFIKNANTIILSNEGKDKSFLANKIWANAALENLVIFSKNGFDIKNLSFDNIKNAYLIADSILNYFSSHDYIAIQSKQLEETRFLNTLSTSSISGYLKSESGDIRLYSNQVMCDGDIVSNGLYFNVFDSKNEVPVQSDLSKCKIKNFKTVVNNYNKLGKFELDTSIESKKLEIYSDSTTAIKNNIIADEINVKSYDGIVQNASQLEVTDIEIYTKNFINKSPDKMIVGTFVWNGLDQQGNKIAEWNADTGRIVASSQISFIGKEFNPLQRNFNDLTVNIHSVKARNEFDGYTINGNLVFVSSFGDLVFKDSKISGVTAAKVPGLIIYFGNNNFENGAVLFGNSYVFEKNSKADSVGIMYFKANNEKATLVLNGDSSLIAKGLTVMTEEGKRIAELKLYSAEVKIGNAGIELYTNLITLERASFIPAYKPFLPEIPADLRYNDVNGVKLVDPSTRINCYRGIIAQNTPNDLSTIKYAFFSTHCGTDLAHRGCPDNGLAYQYYKEDFTGGKASLFEVKGNAKLNAENIISITSNFIVEGLSALKANEDMTFQIVSQDLHKKMELRDSYTRQNSSLIGKNFIAMHTWAQQIGGFDSYSSGNIHIETSQTIPSLINIGIVTEDSGKFHAVIGKLKFLIAKDIKDGKAAQLVAQTSALAKAFSNIQITPEMRDLSAQGAGNAATLKVGGKLIIGNIINNGKFVINASTVANIEALLSFGDLVKEGNGDAKLNVGKFYSGSAIETTITSNIQGSNSHVIAGSTHLTTANSEGVGNSLQAAGMNTQQFFNPENGMSAYSKKLTQASIQNNGDGNFDIISKTTPVFVANKFKQTGKGKINILSDDKINLLASQRVDAIGACVGDNHFCQRSVIHSPNHIEGDVNIFARNGIYSQATTGSGSDTLVNMVTLNGNTLHDVTHDVSLESFQQTITKEGFWTDKTTTSGYRFISEVVNGGTFGDHENRITYFYSESKDGKNTAIGIKVYTKDGAYLIGNSVEFLAAYSKYQTISFHHTEKDGIMFGKGKIITHSESGSTSFNSREVPTIPVLDSLNALSKVNATKGNAVIQGDVISANDIVEVMAKDADVNVVPPVYKETKAAEQYKKESSLFATLNAKEASIGFRMVQEVLNKAEYISLPVKPFIGGVKTYLTGTNVVNNGADLLNAIINVIGQYSDVGSKSVFGQTLQKQLKESVAKFGLVNNYAQVYENAKETAEAAENGEAINAGFAAYKTYISFLKALVSPVSINLSVSYKIDNHDIQVSDVRAVPSTYKGDTFITADSVIITGSQIAGGTFHVKGQMVKLLAATNSFTKTESGGGQTFTFDIANAKLGAVLQKTIGKEKAETKQGINIAINDFIVESKDPSKPSVLEIEGQVYAKNININMQDMVLRSIFSHMSNNLKSGNIGVGFSYNDVKGVLDGVGAHVNVMDSSWIDKLSSALGTEKVNVVLSGVLKVVGAILANAEHSSDGKLTDNGKMTIKAAELIGINLTGHREGVTVGAAIEFASKNSNIFGNSYSGTVGYEDFKQYVRATVGKGTFEVGKTSGSINTDLNNAESVEGTKIDPIKWYFEKVNYDELQKELGRQSFTGRVTETFENFKNTILKPFRSEPEVKTPAPAPEDVINLDEKAEENIKEKVEALEEASNLDEDAMMDEIIESIYADEKMYDQDGDELIDLDIMPEQKWSKLYDEPIGPKEIFADRYEVAKKQIEKMPISKQEKERALGQLYYALREISALDDKGKDYLKKYLEEKSKPHEQVSIIKDILMIPIRLFTIQDANAVPIVPAVITAVETCMATQCAWLIAGALGIKTGQMAKEAYENDIEKGSFWTSEHKNGPSVLSTPAVEEKAEKHYTPIHEDKPSDQGFTPFENEWQTPGGFTPWDNDYDINTLLKDIFSSDKKFVDDLYKNTDIKKHEGGSHNGHTIERHVGKSYEYLDSRIVNEKLKSVSSYHDVKTANKVVEKILKEEKYNIQAWLKTAKDGKT